MQVKYKHIELQANLNRHKSVLKIINKFYIIQLKVVLF